MERTHKPVKRLRRSLVLGVLHDADTEDGYGNDTRDQSSAQEVVSSEQDINLTTGNASFDTLRAWLADECAQEETRSSSFEPARSQLDREAYAAAVKACNRNGTAIDTSALSRLRSNEPRDVVVEDLLAPLRLDSAVPGPDTGESYTDMKRMLHAWNTHILQSHHKANTTARAALLAALYARLEAGEKVLKITRDKRASEMYDAIGQEAILEPRTIQVLKALHLYRRETAQFATRDPIEVLLILWANVRPEVPDIKEDEELRYLTLKVLVQEQVLGQRQENEAKRRRIVKKVKEQRAKGEKEAYERWKGWLKEHEKDVAQNGVQHCVDAVLATRGELRKVVKKEMLELALLQAAQKHACAELHHMPVVTTLYDNCVSVDTALDRAVRHHFPDLDATCDVAGTTVAEMRRIHNRVLTRALKFSGRDLADETLVDRVVRERLEEPATAMMMSDTLNDVKQAGRAAGQMLRQVETMEKAMEEMVEVVRARWREYDALVGVLDGERGVEVWREAAFEV